MSVRAQARTNYEQKDGLGSADSGETHKKK
jgi:hypothetical protein